MATVFIQRDQSNDPPFRCSWSGDEQGPLELERGETIDFSKDSGIDESVFVFLEPQTAFQGAQTQPFPSDATPEVRDDVEDGTTFRWGITDDPDPSKRQATLASSSGGNGQVSGPRE